MEKILVFSGTTEGRLLAEYMKDMPVQVYVSNATEYGRVCAGEFPNAEVLAGRMDVGEMEAFMKGRDISLVIDATHPFAIEVTENIKKACAAGGINYIRCLRDREEDSAAYPEVIEVSTVKEAAMYLKRTEGNILITTGSKELKEYTEIEHYKERCYARVLSTLQSVKDSVSLGFEGAHLIAMQGPFSEEMNLALIRQTKASWFVTKESGKAGGFEEKLRAAEKAGITLIVVGRPKEEGMNLKEVMNYLKKLQKNKEEIVYNMNTMTRYHRV